MQESSQLKTHRLENKHDDTISYGHFLKNKNNSNLPSIMSSKKTQKANSVFEVSLSYNRGRKNTEQVFESIRKNGLFYEKNKIDAKIQKGYNAPFLKPNIDDIEELSKHSEIDNMFSS
jgi:hypothetical protein